MEKITKNQQKISFVEAISNTQKLKNLKKNFAQGCDGAHPEYKKGYNTRHFNYLKSSSNLTHGHNKSVAPSYLTDTNHHLNPNYVTKEKFFNVTSTQNKKVMSLIGSDDEKGLMFIERNRLNKGPKLSKKVRAKSTSHFNISRKNAMKNPNDMKMHC